MKKAVYSFDVFDTALVRIWAKPTDLFWELGYQLQQENLITISTESWLTLRIGAEKNARQKSATGEVTLQYIYDEIATFLNWSIDDKNKCLQKEIQLELFSLRPVPVIKRRIQALHQVKNRVVYISDMYLSKETVILFLQTNDIWADKDTLYISSEAQVNKASGKLFQKCLAIESLKASCLNHVGDNLYSDVKVPKSLGIQIQYFTQSHLNRYEKKISESLLVTLKFRSLIAGTSRLTRLQFQGNSSERQVIWDTAASVIAPVLFGFVYWCLVEAKTKGIQRLYFVARDGQILLKIANIICSKWGYNIECRYLYGSRQSWHFPAIQKVSEAELEWIFDSTCFLSVFSVCTRVNLTPEKIKAVLIKNGFLERNWNKNLDKHQRALLKQVFGEKEIIDLIVSTAADYRKKTIGYFQQEGMGDNVPFGIVDIGWNGRLQRSLSQMLNSAMMYPKCGVYGFYFALAKRLKVFPTDHLLAYFSDVDNPSKRDYLCQYRALFELFVAADHGGTVRFERGDGKYIPILRSVKNEKALKWGLAVQQEAIAGFTEQVTTILNEQDCEVDFFLKISEILLEEFTQRPNFKESKVFGAFTFAEDQYENIYYELAPRYSLWDCCKLLILGQNVHSNVWLNAATSRSNKLARIIISKPVVRASHKIRSALRKLKSTIISMRLE